MRVNNLLRQAGDAVPLAAHNIPGTGERRCSCGCWLKHWQKHSGLPIGLCSSGTCLNAATVGAHVWQENGIDQSAFIVPLCARCNQLQDTIILAPGTHLAPAHSLQVCAR